MRLIQFPTETPLSYWFKATIKMDQLEAMQMHIHPPNAQVGINFQYWVTPVYTVFLEKNVNFYDFRITREAVFMRNTEEHPCVEDPAYDRFNCVKNKTIEWYLYTPYLKL